MNNNTGGVVVVSKQLVVNCFVWLEGGRPLAAADAEDGGPTKAG